MNVLEVKNLCYAYIKKPLCLKDVSFSLEKKQRALVLALDDMGKTTLLKTVSGFDDKYFGSCNGINFHKVYINDSKLFITKREYV